MNKYVPALLITAIIALILELPGWWWAMPIAGLVGGWLVHKGGKGFLTGGSGVVLAWAVLLIYFAMISQLGALAGLFAGILGVGKAMAFVPILLAMIVAFLLGGFGGLTGGFFASVRRT